MLELVLIITYFISIINNLQSEKPHTQIIIICNWLHVISGYTIGTLSFEWLQGLAIICSNVFIADYRQTSNTHHHDNTRIHGLFYIFLDIIRFFHFYVTLILIINFVFVWKLVIWLIIRWEWIIRMCMGETI